MTECMICGKDEEEFREDYDRDADFREHQGVTKCVKCYNEYQRAVGGETNNESDSGEPEASEQISNSSDTRDWKEQITA